MRFDIYGHRELEVVRESGPWRVYSVGAGIRVPSADVVIPPEVAEREIATFLDDLFHELARPGQSVTRIS